MDTMMTMTTTTIIKVLQGMAIKRGANTIFVSVVKLYETSASWPCSVQ